MSSNIRMSLSSEAVPPTARPPHCSRVPGGRVIVFEREKFPRFHIGESLLPFSMKAFTRLGLHEEFLEALGRNVGNNFPIRWRMWVFYFLVWLQRHRPVAPKLTLVPKKQEAPAVIQPTCQVP